MNPADFNLNPAQAKVAALFLAKQHPIIALVGGWGVGKTRMIPYIMHYAHEHDSGINGAYVTDSMSRGARTIANEIGKILQQCGWVFKSFFNGTPAPHWLSPVHSETGLQTRVWALSWTRPSTKSKSANSLEGPDLGWMIADECNVFDDEEIAVAMLGRVRSGRPGRIILLGKPANPCWWRNMADARNEHPGGAFKACSDFNRENIPFFDAWLETLTEREVMENLRCQPVAPLDSILSDFHPEQWPKGNLTKPDWKPIDGMPTHVCIDFGTRYPAALVLSFDETLADGHGGWVIWHEAVPDDASVFDVCTLLKQGNSQLGIPGIWPHYRDDKPKDKIYCSHAFGDKAGRQRRDDAELSSAAGDFASWPSGFGLHVNTTTDIAKTNIINGIKTLQRLVLNNSGSRRLFVSHHLWHSGQNLTRRTISSCVTKYRWQTGAKAVPRKGIYDHSIDALRYWAVMNFFDSQQSMIDGSAAFKDRHKKRRRPFLKPGAGDDR